MLHVNCLIRKENHVMKKICVFILLLFLSSCSLNHQNPETVLDNIIKDEYQNAKIIKTKAIDNYYLALLDNTDNITLVVLKKENNIYKLFGSGRTSKNPEDYGLYNVISKESILIPYFDNRETNYTVMSISCINFKNSNETLTINENISNEDFVLSLYILPPQYQYSKIEFK